MQNQHWSYDLLTELISQKNVTYEDLEELKAEFADEIGSKRRYTCIRTLQDLLDVLQRRDIINENNIEILNNFGEYFDDDEINDALSQYKQTQDLCEQVELENEYALERIEDETQEGLQIGNINISNHTDPPIPVARERISNPFNSHQFDDPKRERVYKLICTEIGRRWRDFGREIGIREGEMDNLESDYSRDSKLKIRKVLELFETDEREDPRRIVLRICSALENCRRKDLSERIQEIMSR